MRLSAPTVKTFVPALAMLVAGVAGHLGYLGGAIDGETAYWLTAVGGGLLALGSLFRKI